MRSSEEKIYIRCPTCGDLVYRQCVTSLRLVDGKWSVVQCFKCGSEAATRTKAHEKPISGYARLAQGSIDIWYQSAR